MFAFIRVKDVNEGDGECDLQGGGGVLGDAADYHHLAASMGERTAGVGAASPTTAVDLLTGRLLVGIQGKSASVTVRPRQRCRFGCDSSLETESNMIRSSGRFHSTTLFDFPLFLLFVCFSILFRPFIRVFATLNHCSPPNFVIGLCDWCFLGNAVAAVRQVSFFCVPFPSCLVLVFFVSFDGVSRLLFCVPIFPNFNENQRIS